VPEPYNPFSPAESMRRRVDMITHELVGPNNMDAYRRSIEYKAWVDTTVLALIGLADNLGAVAQFSQDGLRIRQEQEMRRMMTEVPKMTLTKERAEALGLINNPGPDPE
jgi:hypothetical protein